MNLNLMAGLPFSVHQMETEILLVSSKSRIVFLSFRNLDRKVGMSDINFFEHWLFRVFAITTVMSVQ